MVPYDIDLGTLDFIISTPCCGNFLCQGVLTLGAQQSTYFSWLNLPLLTEILHHLPWSCTLSLTVPKFFSAIGTIHLEIESRNLRYKCDLPRIKKPRRSKKPHSPNHLNPNWLTVIAKCIGKNGSWPYLKPTVPLRFLQPITWNVYDVGTHDVIDRGEPLWPMM